MENEERPGHEKQGSGAKESMFAASPATAYLLPLAANVPAAVEVELVGCVRL